jgi:hypothetical protein
MLRSPEEARAVGLAATGFAAFGFLVGLTITARAGHLPDIAYHAAVLPLLVAGFAVLVHLPHRRPTASPGDPYGSADRRR